MLALLVAIQKKFTADTALMSAFPGGLWRGLAPETTPGTYLVMDVVAAPLDSAYGGSERAGVAIDFKAYGPDDADQTAAAIELFVTKFKDAILTLASGQNSDTRRLCDPIPQPMPHDGQGQDVWRWLVQYQFTVRS